ncbi:DUF4037 domain-containing protein [Halobacillus rhizosphaerae]|uniref:DUF4037 domain-containing protein n=1 Tax=Halobacillus rhizosphaerae TaxID=3064889 RepID=UPI00398B2776
MKLRNIAHEIGKLYSRNEKVSAVLLAGSVSRGWEDGHSDIELHVIWNQSPSSEDRMEVIRRVNGVLKSFYPYEDEEWSETYWYNGVKMEISNFLCQTIDKTIDRVTKEYSTNLEDQCLVAAVHDGIPLHGNEKISQFKHKTAVYPDGLKRAMLTENMELGSRWDSRVALQSRGDYLMLYDLMAAVEKKVMAQLFAHNKLYVHHPAFKWQRKSLEQMSRVPEGIGRRLEQVFISDVESGLRELETIVGEVEQLVIADL